MTGSPATPPEWSRISSTGSALGIVPQGGNSGLVGGALAISATATCISTCSPRHATAAALTRAGEILNQHVDAYHGSISAEHGIGRLKRADFRARQDPVARALLAALKTALDPDGRMNPGALHG